MNGLSKLSLLLSLSCWHNTQSVFSNSKSTISWLHLLVYVVLRYMGVMFGQLKTILSEINDPRLVRWMQFVWSENLGFLVEELRNRLQLNTVGNFYDIEDCYGLVNEWNGQANSKARQIVNFPKNTFLELWIYLIYSGVLRPEVVEV